MNALISLLGSEFCRNLMMALVHTLWQGLLVAGLLYAYLRAVPAEAANKRYAAGAISLLAIVLGGLLTWSILDYTPERPVAETDRPSVNSSVVDETPFTIRVASVSPARTEGILPSDQEPDAHAAAAWYTWAMGLWLLGAIAMLLRAIGVMMGGGRLQKRCVPVEDEAILASIEPLRQQMRIGRRVRVVTGEHLSVPGVVGCLWPTLLLPASLVSGVPTDDLQAILAHELAHIKRFDYLANFFQMVIEALLFFNPSVWWISRQMRIEREACCDLAGVALTGRKTEYAQTLVAWAQRLRDQRVTATAALVGFADGADEGPLLDRVRRIVVAGHRPRLRVSWPVALAMLLLSALALTALWQGTDAAVAFAGNILTPQQRIDAITDISQEYGYEDREYREEDKVLVSGAVRTYDGRAVPKDLAIMLHSKQLRHETTMSIGVSTKDQPLGVATFSNRVGYGRMYLMACTDEYAPAFAGPFDPDPGEAIEEIELVLAEGFPGRIRTVDEDGQPIERTQIVGGYLWPDSGSYHHTIKLITDPHGIATQEHAAEHMVNLQIEAEGFEIEQAQNLILAPDAITTITLKKARPTVGIVVAEATGQPIEGAQVHVLASVQGTASHTGGHVNSTPDAITDGQGRFELSKLRRDRRHLLFVQAPGCAYRYIWDVESGDGDIRVSLGPKKTIRGRIIGDLSLLTTDPKSGEPVIQVTNGYRYARSGYSDASGKSPVTVREGVGHFEIDDFWGQTVAIQAGLERVLLDPERDNLEGIVIDLSPSMRRRVVLQFATPAGGPPIEGSVRIDYITDRARRQRQSMTPEWLDIREGRAECDIPVPADFKYNIDFRKGQRPVGYWFNEISTTRIEPSEEPFVLDVPTYPAGAIYGRIFGPDGDTAKDAKATLKVCRQPDIEGGNAFSSMSLHDALNGSVERGTFNATPLPLGGDYAIVAYEDYAFAMSDVFSLDEKRPIANVDLMLPRGVDVQGYLLDADGTPTQGQVCLHVSIKRGEHSWGLSGAETPTGDDGRFILRNVNPGPTGTCSVRVIGRAGYRPAQQEVTDLAAAVVIQLEKGLGLSGVVIDDATGWPVPGVEVYALYIKATGQDVESELLEAEARTNAQGEFVFSNMAAREYRINARGANPASPNRPLTATGGQAEPVVLRVTIPEWSDLKPQPPQRD
jgi:beta-lactamase regulating signal transducer with metallopeptidase domain